MVLRGFTSGPYNNLTILVTQMWGRIEMLDINNIISSGKLSLKNRVEFFNWGMNNTDKCIVLRSTSNGNYLFETTSIHRVYLKNIRKGQVWEEMIDVGNNKIISDIICVDINNVYRHDDLDKMNVDGEDGSQSTIIRAKAPSNKPLTFILIIGYRAI